jgi:fructose-1,6-bisphosphatase/inositol monophosphatase family enzyme
MANCNEKIESDAYNVVQELAHWASTTIRDGINTDFNPKSKGSPADWVTDLDKNVEVEIRKRLSDLFPDHKIVGEELGISGNTGSDYSWYIDPIDGTTNFAHRIPWNAFSISLTYKGTPVVGAVAYPYLNEVFYAWAGHGTYKNSQLLACPEAVPWPGSVVMTELANASWWSAQAEIVHWLADRDITVRIMGSSALALVQVAKGSAQAAILGEASLIDMAASLLIVQEVGLSVRSELQTPGIFPSGALVVAHPTMIDELAEAVFNFRRE